VDDRLISNREIENLMPLKEPADKTRIVQTLLHGKSLSDLEHTIEKRLHAEDSDLSDNDFIELIMKEMCIVLEYIYIPKPATCVQKYDNDVRQPRSLNMGQQFQEDYGLRSTNSYCIFALGIY
jgi:hypothetical protein